MSDPSEHASPGARLSRRAFVTRVTGAAGFALIARFAPAQAGDTRHASGLPDGAPRNAGFRPSAFLEFMPDGRILLHSPKAEMGQGVHTGYATLVAEELGVSPARITVGSAPAMAAHAELASMQYTGGSSSLREAWPVLRAVGASARAHLCAAAAQHTGVARSACHVEDGGVRAGGTLVPFAALLSTAAALTDVPTPPLKPAAQFKYIGAQGGKNAQRVDARPKTDGTAQFGADVRLPGMLHAVFRLAPRPGAFPTKQLKAPRGVQLVTLERGIAVVADKRWRAERAARDLRVTWSGGVARVDGKPWMKRGRILAKIAGHVRRDKGGQAAIAAAQGALVDASFSVPFVTHMCMEPEVFTAQLSGDTCTVWGPMQSPASVRAALSTHLGWPEDRVIARPTLLGGGFGGRVWAALAKDAVTLAKHTGRPVQLALDRAQDTALGHFRPAAFAHYRAVLGADGLPAAVDIGLARARNDSTAPYTTGLWQYPTAAQTIRTAAMMDGPLRTGPWRSVDHSYAAFFAERFVDRLAEKAGRDPLEYRRALCAGSARRAHVLDLVARLSAWGSPLPDGVGRGIALHSSFGSHVAHVVEASRGAQGVVVHAVYCAADVGTAITPDLVKAQMQSAVIQGLSAALYEQITREHGAVSPTNFDGYRVMRMAEAPPIQVVLADNGYAPGGAGEPGVPPIAPALCNALHAANGTHIDALPVTST